MNESVATMNREQIIAYIDSLAASMPYNLREELIDYIRNCI